MRTSRAIRTSCILGLVAVVAAGCGGAAVPPADTGATPAPGTDTSGSTVADPGATPGATDPATGLPSDPAAAGTAPSATVPDLSGDDTSSSAGFGSAVKDSSLFSPQAAGGAQTSTTETTPGSTLLGGGGATPGASTTPSEPTTPTEPAKPKVTYSGAKIYVDGMVHTVLKGATFPKGNPVFKLVSVSAGDIEIELVAGEFTSGGGTGTILDKGELVTMANSSEQITYRLKYLTPIAGSDAIGF
ncbi:MAG: hypothetical protein JWM98_3166 [Thermoleophilia bacterium]|nr:hypothetical protein [Thermoleophilia bacterium]